MSKYINAVGGQERAITIVKYHKEYFKNFKYFDSKKGIFTKKKDETRSSDFIFMNFLIGDVKKIYA